MKFHEKFTKRLKQVNGKAINFRIDEIRLPDGKKAAREYVDHPGAVAVVPLLGGGRTILVRQYRYPIDRITYEIPAGKLDKGEAPLACVKRELEEETGYSAKSVRKLCSFWPATAFSNEVIHIYVACGLKKTEMSPDEDEFISSKTVKISTALKWAKSGKIRDAKSVIGLLMLKARGSRL